MARGDSVPIFRAKAPGPYRVGLVFRVGSADETPPEHGITHLCEHLALSKSWGSRFDFNGVVEPITTTFFAEGRAEEMSRFLTSLCDELRALDTERIEAERGVLLAEAAGRVRSIVPELLYWRYGPRSYGLSAMPELGLHHLGPRDVEEWSTAWFTRGNCALWIGGPDPDEVRVDIDLPDGPRLPPPELPTAVERTPVWAPMWNDIVTIGIVGKRSVALRVAQELLVDRIRANVRLQQGASYDVAGSYVPLDATAAHLAVSADCLSDHTQTVVDGFIAELHRLVTDGPTTDELDRHRDEDDDMPYRDLAEATRLAVDELVGGEHATAREIADQMAGLRNEDVQEALASAVDEAVLLVPPLATVTSGNFHQPEERRAPTAGVTLNPAPTVPPDWKDLRLTVGNEGVSMRNADGSFVTIRYEDCVAIAAWTNGLRYLFQADGYTLQLAPQDWRTPDVFERQLRAAVPPSRWVTMRDAAPYEGHDPEVGRAMRWMHQRDLVIVFTVFALLVIVVTILVAR